MKTGFQITIVILYAACVAAIIYSVYRREKFYNKVDRTNSRLYDSYEQLSLKMMEIEEKIPVRKRTRKK